MAGTFKIVATPIGNLADMSPRAKDALAKARVIFAEDTRRTHQLVQALGLNLATEARLISCYSQVEEERVPVALERLRQGDDVVLVSDAGTPGISDPGTLLVDSVVKEGFSVEVIPGPCAAIAALMGAGLRAPRFAFLGFLPKRSSVRQKLIKNSFAPGLTLVIYESVLRAQTLLDELFQILGPKRVVVARELTKMHETFHRGVLGSKLIPDLKGKGECVIVVEYHGDSSQSTEKTEPDDLSEQIQKHLSEKKLRPKEIAKMLAEEHELSAHEVYALVVAMAQKKDKPS